MSKQKLSEVKDVKQEPHPVESFQYVSRDTLVTSTKTMLAKMELEIHELQLLAVRYGSFELKLSAEPNSMTIAEKIHNLQIQMSNVQETYAIILQ